MDDRQRQATEYVRSLYAYYKTDVDDAVVAHFAGGLCSGALTLEALQEQVREHAMQLYTARQQQQQQQEQQEAAARAALQEQRSAPQGSFGIVTSPVAAASLEPMEDEYVDCLYDKYIGSRKKADVATRSFLIKSLKDKTYSLNQVEWAIQRSPDAVRYAAQQQAKLKADHHHAQLVEYVAELSRVYCHGGATQEQQDALVQDLEQGRTTLQAAEDLLRLQGLRSAPKPPTEAPKKH
eukprot:m51a1_g10271 hypothetical protein (237) ;mRNA; f:43610-44603